jgi:radical SAM protein with 4Fe4S-binding SPASM domain
MSNKTDEPTAQVFCSKPWTSFEVEHDGTVTPCCMAKKACGNVNQNSIGEVWNGEGFREFRQKMADGEWRDICRAECPRLQGSIDDSVGWPQNDEFAANYAKSQAEIANRAIVLESWPRIWKTTASTLCNLDCVMCYQDRKDLRSLPENFYQQMEMLYQFMQEVQVIGGEPFAIKRLRTLMAEFPMERYPDARFAMVSNGTVHDDKTLDIVRRLNVSWMSISVDAATAPTYARIRRGGNFENTMTGVRKWIALGKDKGFPVHVAFCVMRDNVTEMPEFAEMARELGADVLFGQIANPFDILGGQELIDRKALQTALALTRSVVAPPAPMPLANLTLATFA